ncbi:MAG: prepilin-type N-terminal cleavage/methylation domain-containing protein [Lentisphaeraceae bacterium]|nr:prepilin-type N-terminal cleavage/methylation domain-containing protein [Lentisphaeraceae bacterium]
MRLNKRKIVNFTLIELLVVVAIIGILLTLLLPSLSKARMATKTAVSLSNLKQIYQGTISYTTTYNGRFFKSGDNPHPRCIPDSTNWTRMVYEEILGEYISFNNEEARSSMAEGTPYFSLMYCPVLRDIRSSPTQHPQGRADYSMNKYFRDRYVFLSKINGKEEPLVMPGTAIGSSTAGPNLNRGTHEPTLGGHPVYEYPNKRSLALFVDGRVQSISITKGTELDSLISIPSDFE